MPAYDIRYLDGEGFLAHTFSAVCEDDKRARVLAHAMKLPSNKRLEVWNGDALIYARPMRLLDRAIWGQPEQISTARSQLHAKRVGLRVGTSFSSPFPCRFSLPPRALAPLPLGLAP